MDRLIPLKTSLHPALSRETSRSAFGLTQLRSEEETHKLDHCQARLAFPYLANIQYCNYFFLALLVRPFDMLADTGGRRAAFDVAGPSFGVVELVDGPPVPGAAGVARFSARAP